MNRLLPFYLQLLRKLSMRSEKWQLVLPPSVFQLSLHSTNPIFTLLPFTILCDGENIKSMTFMQDSSLSLQLYSITDFLEKKSNVKTVFSSIILRHFI